MMASKLENHHAALVDGAQFLEGAITVGGFWGTLSYTEKRVVSTRLLVYKRHINQPTSDVVYRGS